MSCERGDIICYGIKDIIKRKERVINNFIPIIFTTREIEKFFHNSFRKK